MWTHTLVIHTSLCTREEGHVLSSYTRFTIQHHLSWHRREVTIVTHALMPADLRPHGTGDTGTNDTRQLLVTHRNHESDNRSDQSCQEYADEHE
jgi:hypothetical protein